MALTAAQQKANDDYKSRKIDKATYNKAYITKPSYSSSSSSSSSSTPKTTTTTSTPSSSSSSSSSSSKSSSSSTPSVSTPSTSTNSGTAKMWTGSGYATVGNNYIAQKLKDGWTTSLPTSGEVSNMINMASEGTQGQWSPSTGVTEKAIDTTPNQTLYDPITGNPVSVTGKYVQEYISKGYGTSPAGTQQPANGVGLTNASGTASQYGDLSSDANISAQYQEQTNALVAQLKANIEAAKAEQNNLISTAGQAYDPIRAESELTKAQELRSVLERNANLGDRGGVGRSAALQTQVAGENRLNGINLQEQNYIDSANAEIASLESQGNYQQAEILATQKAAELQALLENQRYNAELAASQATTQTALDAQALAQEQSDFQTQIAANYLDLSAFQSVLEQQGAEQWKIDAVKAAKVQKIIENNLDPATGQPLPVDNTATIWDQALTKWNAGIPLTAQEMSVLGTSTSTKPVSSSGGSSGSSYSFSQAMDDARQMLPNGNPTDIAELANRLVSNNFDGYSDPPPVDTPPTVDAVIDSMRGTSGTTASDELVKYKNAGMLEDFTPAEVKKIMSTYGITDVMLVQSENRLSPLTLPTGNTLNFN